MTKTMPQATENQASSLEDGLSDYVRGRLDAVTARRIEARAEKNEVFAQKLAFEKRIAGVISNPDTSRSLGAGSFEALRARVETPSFGARVAEFFMPQTRGLQWAVPAVLVATLSGALFWSAPMLNRPGLNEFETLSTPNESIVHSPDRQYARVIFAAGLRSGQRTAAAAELGFRIESGPGPLDSYVVSIPRRDGETAGTVEHWCADERVTFCQPIFSGGESSVR